LGSREATPISVVTYSIILQTFGDPTGKQRADRDRPGDIEWARGLKKAIDRMPTPSGCGCQSRPANPLLLAGAVAVADGPQLGPTDIIALAILITAIVSSPPVDCTPPRVIPFPAPRRVPLPPPPPAPNNRDKHCDECTLENSSRGTEGISQESLALQLRFNPKLSLAKRSLCTNIQSNSESPETI
jgi:hypothetical protein